MNKVDHILQTSHLYVAPGAAFWWTRPNTVVIRRPAGTATRELFKHKVMLDSGHWLLCVTIWRWPQNQKCIYCNAARGRRNHSLRLQRAHNWWNLSYASGQTNRQTDILITILGTPPAGEVMMMMKYEGGLPLEPASSFTPSTSPHLWFFCFCFPHFYFFGFISARCSIYISRLCYDVSVRLSVRLSVCDVCALWSQDAMDPGYLCMLG